VGKKCNFGISAVVVFIVGIICHQFVIIIWY